MKKYNIVYADPAWSFGDKLRSSKKLENGNFAKPMLGDVFIRVFCGVSIEDKCRHQLHPLNEVIQAQKSLSLNKSMDFYSNSHDFVSAIKYLCQEKNINCEFFLNGESTGNDIEPIFENFNKSFDLLNELCPNIS